MLVSDSLNSSLYSSLRPAFLMAQQKHEEADDRQDCFHNRLRGDGAVQTGKRIQQNHAWVSYFRSCNPVMYWDVGR